MINETQEAATQLPRKLSYFYRGYDNGTYPTAIGLVFELLTKCKLLRDRTHTHTQKNSKDNLNT